MKSLYIKLVNRMKLVWEVLKEDAAYDNVVCKCDSCKTHQIHSVLPGSKTSNCSDCGGIASVLTKDEFKNLSKI